MDPSEVTGFLTSLVDVQTDSEHYVRARCGKQGPCRGCPAAEPRGLVGIESGKDVRARKGGEPRPRGPGGVVGLNPSWA